MDPSDYVPLIIMVIALLALVLMWTVTEQFTEGAIAPFAEWVREAAAHG